MKSAYDYYSKITIEKTKEMIPQVLESLTYNKAFFTKKELEEKIKAALPNHMQQEGDPLNAVITLIIEEMKLVPLYPSQKEGPWSQFTTASMIAKEREMVELAKGVSDNHEIPGQPNAIKDLVEKAFASRPTMADEQKEVVKASCLTNHNVVIVEGTAGAGKSFSLNAIREVYESIPPRKMGEKIGYDIIGTALSWTATKVLEESAGLTGGMAIEGFVRRMKEAEEKGLEFFNRRTVVIVDEAGLAPTTLMKDILHYAAKSSHDVRVILTGDSLQLNPVQAGNALELLVAECGSTRLDTIRRQKQESHRQAVKHFCYGRAENGLYTHYQQESVHFAKNKDWVLHEVVKDYVKFTTHHPEKSALVLALKNVDVDKLNSLIRESLKREGRVAEKGVFVETYDGRTKKKVEFAVGDQIVFRQNAPKMAVYDTPYEKAQDAIANKKNNTNDGPLSFFKRLLSFGGEKTIARHGVFNRTIGTIIGVKSESDHSYTFQVLLAEGGEVKVNTKDYVNKDEHAFPMTHNFATTIYASQGQTVSKVLMLDGPNMNRKLAYVGASRHTDEFDLYLNCEELNQRIIKKVDRERTKAAEKLKKDIASGKASILAEVEEARLYAQYPKYEIDHQFTQKEYLGVVASSWNAHSLNQTVAMARKQQSVKKKRNPGWVSPLSAWYALVEKAPEDVEDDYIKKTKSGRAVEVEKELEVEKTFLGFSYGKKIEKVLVKEIVPHVEPEGLLPVKETTADLSSLDEKILLSTEKDVWVLNKNEDARVLAFTPNRQVIARYDLEGNSVLGDGEIPVFVNKSGTAQTPFLVVHSFREAVLAHQHYRNKHGDDSVKVPHIVWKAKDAKLNFLLGWLPPNPSVYVAVSKAKNGLENAQNTAKELGTLNIVSDFLPKIKPPQNSNNSIKP